MVNFFQIFVPLRGIILKFRSTSLHVNSRFAPIEFEDTANHVQILYWMLVHLGFDKNLNPSPHYERNCNYPYLNVSGFLTFRLFVQSKINTHLWKPLYSFRYKVNRPGPDPLQRNERTNFFFILITNALMDRISSKIFLEISK